MPSTRRKTRSSGVRSLSRSLPPYLADDPERLARFQREARAVAALNHPNIVVLHSVEESDDTHFLTMELIDGEPLSESIPPGGLALETILEQGFALADRPDRGASTCS